jgi:UDP-glucose 4-epimerase
MGILVTGGTGFVGSHTVVALIEAGRQVHIVDDLSNSSAVVIDRIDAITGTRPGFTRLDVRDTAAVRTVLDAEQSDALIHFAAHKHVAESVEKPLEYYDNNLGSLTSVLRAARDSGLRKIVFSSSGSVYGNATRMPIPEDEPHRPTNPYSTTKSWGERILEDLCAQDPSWSVLALRYFNPAGAHPSGLIGEDPTGLRTNLLPVLLDVAAGATAELVVHGTDFDTPDGSGVRDYVHVMDVARAHVTALDRLADRSGFGATNIGRGEGVSVLQLADAVERATGRTIPRRFGPRRPGDVAALYGDTAQAARELGLTGYASLDELCADAWRWRCANPHGYAT